MRITRFQALQFCREMNSTGPLARIYDFLVGKTVNFPWCTWDSLLKHPEKRSRRLSKRRVQQMKADLPDTRELAEFLRAVAKQVDEYADEVEAVYSEMEDAAIPDGSDDDDVCAEETADGYAGRNYEPETGTVGSMEI